MFSFRSAHPVTATVLGITNSPIIQCPPKNTSLSMILWSLRKANYYLYNHHDKLSKWLVKDHLRPWVMLLMFAHPPRPFCSKPKEQSGLSRYAQY